VLPVTIKRHIIVTKFLLFLNKIVRPHCFGEVRMILHNEEFKVEDRGVVLGR
jgi:hypothetical protein